MNCILVDDDEMSRRLLEDYISRVDFVKLVKSFSNPVEALSFLNSQPENIHLIFLDIEMPEMSGLDFIEVGGTNPQIIIVSSKEKYALKAFDYSVTDYLLKPITFPRFLKGVSRAYEKYNAQRSPFDDNREIFIKKNNSLVRVRYGDILWIEAMENYVIVVTPNERFTIHLTMKSLENQLPSERFKRVHRSYIVNVGKIESIEDNIITIKVLDGKKTIPIGKSYRDLLLKELKMISNK
ncbi:MAG: two-component system, LytTR family, response regulator [Tenuifilum sp.]|jgi:DNA-binding LytR/AlgR family response regulator|uniref:LytR/AlgR family response regulator transcription factor n=1 Tax=Tenuifilum sp. TaxID=2760880 RepID=UPI0024AABB2B|nr:LytTR family DNA-binding domain-containing protein [Tenuifilum sp.]MDI3526636.1 two-component system, LytTR family, response regulator [Tenuifilum sp.]